MNKATNIKIQNYFMIGQFSSTIGDIIGIMGLSWWAFTVSKDIMVMAKVIAPSAILRVVLPSIIGFFAESYSKKKLILSSYSLSILSWVLILACVLNKYFNVQILSTLMAIATFSIMIFRVSSISFLTEIIEKDKIQSFMAKFQSLGAFSRIIAASLGGILISTIGPSGTILLNILTFFLAFLTVLLLQPIYIDENKKEKTSKNTIKNNISRSLKDPLELLKKNSYIMIFIVFLFIAQFLLIPMTSLLVAYVKLAKSLPAWTLGLFETACAAGVIVASFRAKNKNNIESPNLLLLVSIGFLAISFLENIFIVSMFLFIINFCFIKYIIPLKTSIILSTPNSSRTKMSGLMNTVIELASVSGIVIWSYISKTTSMNTNFFFMGLVGLTLFPIALYLNKKKLKSNINHKSNRRTLQC